MRRLVLSLFLVAVALCALPAGASAFGPLSSFGSLGAGAGQMFAVRGLAVSPDGRIYVSDIGNERVDVFSPNGDFLLAFGKGVNAVDASDICTPLSGCKRGTRSGAAGGFNLPQGLDVGPEGNVFVADEGNNRIDVFKANGEFVLGFGKAVNAQLGSPSPDVCTATSQCKAGLGRAEAGAMATPKAVGFDTAGHVFVADNANNRIDVYSLGGQFDRAFGKEVNLGAGNPNVCESGGGCKAGTASGLAGAIREPTGVVVTPTGQFLVSDSTNNRIDLFSGEGSLIRAFGTEVNPKVAPNRDVCTEATECKAGAASSEAGGVNLPSELALDSENHVYVADRAGSRIAEFNLDGSFVRAFGTGVLDGGGAFQVCTLSCRQGTQSATLGSLFEGYGVALDSHGAIYASTKKAVGAEEFVQVVRFGEPTPPPTVTPPPKPSNRFAFGRLTLNRRKGSATLSVAVPGPGSLSLSGKGVRPATATARSAGNVRLAIVPSGAARRRLAATGAAKLRVQVTFVPGGGEPATAARSVRLKRTFQ
jgi:hypothetical protein